VNISPALDRVGKEMIARRPLSRFIQIDRLVSLVTAIGSRTISPIDLPHGRYTLFMAYNPPAAAQSVSFIDRAGHGFPDWTSVPVTAGEVIAPLVQEELKAGTYQLQVEATATCCWKAELVLNSMQSWAAPPPAWRRLLPPPQPILLGSSKSLDFRIEQIGTYATDFMIDGFTIGQHVPHVMLCPFSLALRAADGHLVKLGAGTKHKASWPSGAFLGAGNWQVEIETKCEWELTLRPMLGPSGGGAHWF
jgi:hypothetical protein